MRSLGQVLYPWLVDVWHNLWELLVFNLLWLILCVPLVTAPAAIAGLYYATNQLAHEREVNWKVFFDGFRLHFWLGWRWGLINLLIVALVVSNYIFYARFQAKWSAWVQGAILGLFVIWDLLQIYTFPLLLEQSERKFIVALRNSLVMYLKFPGFSLGMGLIILIVAVLLTRFAWPTWLVLNAGLITYMSNRATIYLVDLLEVGNSDQNQQGGV
jgi:hypothetical protein